MYFSLAKHSLDRVCVFSYLPEKRFSHKQHHKSGNPFIFFWQQGWGAWVVVTVACTTVAPSDLVQHTVIAGSFASPLVVLTAPCQCLDDAAVVVAVRKGYQNSCKEREMVNGSAMVIAPRDLIWSTGRDLSYCCHQDWALVERGREKERNATSKGANRSVNRGKEQTWWQGCLVLLLLQPKRRPSTSNFVAVHLCRISSSRMGLNCPIRDIIATVRHTQTHTCSVFLRNVCMQYSTPLNWSIIRSHRARLFSSSTSWSGQSTSCLLYFANKAILHCKTCNRHWMAGKCQETATASWLGWFEKLIWPPSRTLRRPANKWPIICLLNRWPSPKQIDIASQTLDNFSYLATILVMTPTPVLFFFFTWQTN